MSNVESVRAQIRFHLAELSTRNEHHAFEYLCQEVAKARICSNIVPATGPVSAGGDQGRDFETFKTYLQEDSSLDSSAFLGLLSEGVVVFACSTEQNPAATKLRSDVDKIMASGEKPECIYFFSTHNIPVSRRHTVQKEVCEAYGVTLEVLDSQALALHLANPELFWVAEQYLHLPSELRSALPEKQEWHLPAVDPRPIEAEAYRDWLIAKTSEFYVPGAGVSLPISKAWAKLEAQSDSKHGEPALAQDLEEWIASRREWERLGLRESWIIRDLTTFDADRVVLAGDRTVIVSGPGGGKSTLQSQLANRLSLEGKNVCFVRLPLVADRMAKEKKTFREALLELTADNSGLDERKLAAVLEHPDYLLVDGLDECDSFRATVAKELSSWANGHPRSRIVVTTRPVGHNAGLLPSWRHLELLPLDEDAALQHARNILEELAEDPDTLEKFWNLVKENETAARAAGNPLLLGFLVRLFVDGVPFGRRRAELYGQIVREIREREPRHGSSETKISLTVADRALEKIGWLLQHETIVSGQEVVEGLGAMLAAELDLPNLAANQKAEECLTFWEERGLLERLTAGSREALMFVHAALGEYAAGRYASRMDEETLIRWITEVRRDPRWREVVLLAAGVGSARPIIETLLSFHDPQDPVGEEIETAARALAEVPEPPVDLLRKVVEALCERLTGNVPAVIFDVAESALGISREAPDVVGPALRPLTRHTQFATRLAVVRLLLECGTEHVDFDVLKRAMEELLLPNEGEHELPQRRGITVWDFQDQIIYLGVKHLVRSRPRPETMSLVERVSIRGTTSVGAHFSLAQFLDEEGYEELAEKAAKGSFYTPRRSKVPWDLEKWRRAREEEDIAEDRTFLELVLEAVGDAERHRTGGWDLSRRP